MELTTREKNFLQAYKKADITTKGNVDKMLSVESLKNNKFGLFVRDFIEPPYPILKDIQFWITAIDDSFKDEGIEKGDLLGCFMSEEFSDEPKNIHILAVPGFSTYRLGKIDILTDFGEPGAMIYFDSNFVEKVFVSEEDLFTKFNSLGIVKLIIKCKEY